METFSAFVVKPQLGKLFISDAGISHDIKHEDKYSKLAVIVPK